MAVKGPQPEPGYAAHFAAARAQRAISAGASPERMPRKALSARGSISPKNRAKMEQMETRSMPAGGDGARSPTTSPGRKRQAVKTTEYSRQRLRLAMEQISILGANMSSKEQQETRSWLRALQLEVLPDEERGDLLDNPLRNGVLLCELISHLDGCPFPGVSRHPKDMMSCRRNLNSALKALGLIDKDDDLRTTPTKEQSAGLTWQVERILQGNRDALWALITYLRKSHPKAILASQSDVVVVNGNVMRASLGTGESVVRSREGRLSPQSSPPRQVWRSIQLPYDHASTCALEQSLMGWLHCLGLVDAAVVQRGLDAVMSRLSDGTLLCDLVAAIEGVPISGVNRRPKTDKVRHANIHRALDRLWAQRKMSRRYLKHPESLLRGERPAVVGLLEDLHRFADGQPARPEETGEGEQPYLKGTFVGIYGPLVEHPAIPRPASPERAFSPSRAPWCPPNYNHKRMQQRSPSPGRASSPGRDRPAEMQSPSHRRQRSSEGQVQRSAASQPWRRMVNDGRSPSPRRRPPPDRAAMAAAREQQQMYPEGLVRDPPSVWEQAQQVRTWAVQDLGDKDPEPASDPRLETTLKALATKVHVPPESTANPTSEERLTRWIEALGLDVTPRWPLETACRDGTLLCQLVGKLEHAPIQGTTANPKNQASRLHNMTKALEVLRKKPNMPIDHLWKERALVQGVPGLSMALLLDIRKAYRSVWTAALRSSSVCKRRQRASDVTGQEIKSSKEEKHGERIAHVEVYANPGPEAQRLVPNRGHGREGRVVSNRVG